jgi:N-succinyldiaminopimelate aminotransferase
VTAARLGAFGTTIFSEMTSLALAHGAINLSQGFPDFDGPDEIIAAAAAAMRAGHNQYARSMGVPALTEAIARHQQRHYDLAFDPATEVVVFSGATEGIASSLLGLLDPGDEVILFEPFYDSYPACVALASAVPRFCTLRAPDFRLDLGELEALFSPRTRAIIINTPHNPTGKVFTRDELDAIAELCRRYGTVVVSDEVYEHLTYDGAEHVPMATLPGMRERTLTLSSAGKTFSLTGWKVGWATGPAPLVAAAQAAHQFVTFATATPLQHAVAHALDELGDGYYAALRREYSARRDFLVAVLEEVGFRVSVPRGTYFIVADFGALSQSDDRSFARELVKRCRVAAIPPSAFYAARPEEGRRLLRFAFCKQLETLRQAAERLRTLAPR